MKLQNVEVTEHLGVVVKYFSDERNEIISTFLEIRELLSSDARGIADISLIENLILYIKK